MLNKILLLVVCGEFVVAQIAPKIVGPLYVETVENVNFYEKLVYVEFKVLNAIYDPDQSLLVLENVACSFPQNPSYACPLKGPIEELEKLLRPVVTPSMTLLKEDSSQNPVGHDVCHRFTPPLFPSLYVTDPIYNAVYNSLVKCDNYAGTSDDRIFVEILDYMMIPFRDRFTESFNAFYGEHSYNATDRSATISTLTSLEETLNIGGFLHQFAEKTRFEDAVGRCKFAHVLPPSVISTVHLEEALDKVNSSVSSKGYVLAVSPTSELSSYWSIPTVDCAFQANAILSVAFGVPVKKRETQVSLHKLSSLPFHATYEETSFTCMRMDFVEEKYVQFEERSKRVVEVGYSEGGSLYRLVEKPKGFLTKGAMNSCVSSVLAEVPNGDEIYLNCPLECTVDSEGDDPFVVRQLASDTFVISAATLVPGGVTFTCPGAALQVVVPPVEGAVKVSAPCGCSFSLFEELSVEVEMPCRETGTLITENIVPFEISRFKQRGGSSGGLKFINWP